MRWSPDSAITPIHPVGGGGRFALAGDAILVATGSELLQVRTDPVPHACRNGRDDDGDALVDLADPGCNGALDASERSDELPCDDGLDNDGDGFADLPDDPGCASWTAPTESPACDDGLDNDGDGRIDWNGAGAGAPDPQCGDNPSSTSEGGACGLGFELVLLALLARRVRRRTRAGS